jgi:hypothetical protein
MYELEHTRSFMIIGSLQVGMTMFAGRSVVTPTVETVRTGKIVCGFLLRLVSVSGTVAVQVNVRIWIFSVKNGS